MGGRGKIRSSSRGRRRGKRSIKLVEQDEKDRISELSDDLINQILSYVPSDVAVKTMLLSKRWVNLWTTLPCLNFQPQPPPFSGSENFVENFMKNRDQQYVLSTCTIDCYQAGVNILPICLNYVRSHNVEDLSILNAGYADSWAECYALYTAINFACLKTLHLTDCKKLYPMDSWTLPSLTSLYVKKDKIGKQMLGFENLKVLTLVEHSSQLQRYAGMTITINCPKLQRLTLSLKFRYTFIVATPILSYMNYSSRLVSGFSAGDGFPCIKQVHIDIWKNDRDFFGDPSEMEPAMQNFISMLKSVRNTPFLELSSETVEGLRMIPDLSNYEHSSLDNLKYISLRGPGLFDMRQPRTTKHVIDYLLTNSPSAKTITRL